MIPKREFCPFCGASHSCSLHGHYKRDMIVLYQGRPLVHPLSVKRLLCSSCGHTHAFLPACLIPHASYSLRFILSILRLYFLRKDTVASLCLQFSISASTLYVWIQLFHQHKALWLGVLLNASVSSLHFLNLLEESPSFLHHFFLKANLSFLQHFRFPSLSGLP